KTPAIRIRRSRDHILILPLPLLRMRRIYLQRLTLPVKRGLMTMTSAPLSPLVLILIINEWLTIRAIDGLTDEHLWHRVSEQNNPMFWLVGHLVPTRARLLNALGESFDTVWGDAFARGSSVEDPANYARREVSLEMMTTVNQRLYAKMSAIGFEDVM